MTEETDIIYGAHPVEEALKNPARKFISLRCSLNAAEKLKPLLASVGLTPEILAPKALDKLVEPDAVHQGMVLMAKALPQPQLDEIDKSGLVVLLDQVTDPHNVGAILRSCAACGVSALITTARHSPQGSGVLFKAASGAYEHVPYVKVTNLARAINELQREGFRFIGLDSDAPTTLDTIDKSLPLAIVLGAEGKGLRELTRKHCDEVVRLDFKGAIHSLNVSNAAAIVLYTLTH